MGSVTSNIFGVDVLLEFLKYSTTKYDKMLIHRKFIPKNVPVAIRLSPNSKEHVKKKKNK